MRIFQFGNKIAAECEPQKRSIFITGTTDSESYFLALPYISFFVSYHKYILAMHPYGLQVVFHENPELNYNKSLLRCPFGYVTHDSSVCMGECWPKGFYFKKEKMIKDVISCFWQSKFNCYTLGGRENPVSIKSLNFWKKKSKKCANAWKKMKFELANPICLTGKPDYKRYI